MKAKHHVYLAQNPQGRRHIDVAQNVMAHIKEHNNGFHKATAEHAPWELIWRSRLLLPAEAHTLCRKMVRARKEGRHALIALMSAHAEGTRPNK